MQCAKTHGFEMQKQNTIEMLLECTFIIFDIWQVCLKDSYKSMFFPLRRRSKGALQSGHRLIHQRAESRNEFTTQLPCHNHDHFPLNNSTSHNAVKVGANETEALETFESNEMFDTNEASEFEQHSPNEYQPEDSSLLRPTPAMAAAPAFCDMCFC